MGPSSRLQRLAVCVIFLSAVGDAFVFSVNRNSVRSFSSSQFIDIHLKMSVEPKQTEVVELLGGEKKDDIPAEEEKMVAPFISQGELADDVLNPDFSDPKQTRVIIYTVISLLPVLLLIPLMLSRELIPLDNLPPVEL